MTPAEIGDLARVTRVLTGASPELPGRGRGPALALGKAGWRRAEQGSKRAHLCDPRPFKSDI